ncbi:MAG TPA: hypothetical protein DCX53_16025, partial [Anaerolineae bacterium]|nr:hypothetical protein [Anaerolineae bacterium]
MEDQISYSGLQLPSERSRGRKELFLIIFFLVIFACVIILPIVTQWQDRSTLLPVSLHSIREADYSPDRDGSWIPIFNINIIRDILLDLNLPSDDYQNRMATITSVLLSPIPTATGVLTNQGTATAIGTNTPVPNATSTSLPTAITSPNPTLTPASTATKNPPSPSIRLIKSVASYVDNDLSGNISPGDDLRYRFTITNTGNTDLSLVSAVDLTFGIPITCPGSNLSEGASMICTAGALHRVTLAEANAGQVVNTASASGDYGAVRYSDADTLTTAVTQNPSFQIIKSVSLTDDNDSSGTLTQGDGLWYQFDVTNTGNVTLINLDVNDDTYSLPVTCPVTALAPGGSTVCNTTAAHIITAAEIAAGEIVNTATVSGNVGSTIVTASDTLTTPLSIQIIKRLASYDDNDLSGSITFGDGLWYAFDITNLGSVSISSISVTDNTYSIAVTCPGTNLASGASMTCTANSSHVITLAEANSGSITNTASVTGLPPSGPAVDDTDSLTTVVARDAELTISKSAAPLTYASVGTLINYTFTVTNTGNVTVTGPITVSDDKATNETCPAGSLNPGAFLTCTASVITTQGDLDAGSITNTAFASGTGPGGAPVVSLTDSATVNAVQSPSIQISKFAASYADNDSSGTLTLGDDLSYRFNVVNTGNVTLNPVTVTDNTFGISVTCPATVLAPSASTLCVADLPHTISLAESNAGQVTNTATARGDLGGTPYTDSDTITTPVIQNPALEVTKTASPMTYASVGQVINYTYTIRNSGNVT